MKEIVVFTAITGDYDTLKPPPDHWRAEADFVAFVEKPHSSSGWDFRPIHRTFSDPCRNAKIHKIVPHRFFPDARFSLWLDGSIQVKAVVPLRELIASLLAHHDLAVFPHRRRNCIYEEAEACIVAKKDSPDIIRCQMQAYRESGYPENNGLVECTVIVRHHTEPVRKFNEMWYDEITKYSRRDQLSFNYVAAKTGFVYARIPGLLSKNDYFKRHPHAPRLLSVSAQQPFEI
jgi:hypothetical protein